MRRILFRAKLDNEYYKNVGLSEYSKHTDWVYGYYTEFSSISNNSCIENINDDFVIDKITLGQYLNKNDINGMSIYEGDIVEFDNDFDNLWGDTEHVTYRAQIVWSEEHLAFGALLICDDCIQYPEFVQPEFIPWEELKEESLTVIGNVVDNPTLLTEPYIRRH